MWAQFREIDGHVLKHIQFRALVEALAVWAHFREVDVRVLGGMQFGVLVHALFWAAV